MARPKQRTAIATLLEDPATLPGACRLPLDRIQANPRQFRRYFDPAALTELAEDIRQHGVLEPIIVVPAGDDYMVVAGERRRRAALEAAQTLIPAIIRADLSPADAALRMATENLQRQDFTVGDEARMYQELKGLIPPPTAKERDSDGRLSNRALAEYLHIAVSRVDRALQLLRRPEVLTQVESGTLTLRAALDAIRPTKDPRGAPPAAEVLPQVRHGDALATPPGAVPPASAPIGTGIGAPGRSDPSPPADRGAPADLVPPEARAGGPRGTLPTAWAEHGRGVDPVGWTAISTSYRAIGAIRPEQVPLEVVADLEQQLADLEVLIAATRRALRLRLGAPADD